MSTDDFKDLRILHGKDLAHYHSSKCEGVIQLTEKGDTLQSWCSLCELLVTSTRATVASMRSRDGKNE